MLIKRLASSFALVAGLLLPFQTLFAEAGNGKLPFERSETRSPCDNYTPEKIPLFGDTHVHTSLSLDASLQGTRTTPDEAYRFAKGEMIGLQPWTDEGKPLRTLKLERPLDFVALSDHAEFLGEQYICETPGAEGYNSKLCRFYRWSPDLAFMFMNSRLASEADRDKDGWAKPIKRFAFCGKDGELCRQGAKPGWDSTQKAAEKHYDRSSNCSFTTFVGYEWSASPGTENLHRNVIFRNHNVPDLPPSYLDYPDPEQLWKQLDKQCLSAETGCDVLAIPHNSNISAGRMFAPQQSNGEAFSTPYATTRKAMEPLVEIYQHKGDSECGLNANDELCDFEFMPYDNLRAGRFGDWFVDNPRQIDFVRTALREGIRYKSSLGVNPFKLGIIGSTDTHIGTPGAVSEKDFPGHGGAGRSAREEVAKGFSDSLYYSPGGLAVVWAEENSRDAIFSAMRNREVYGTSGPRIVLRFFAGDSLPEQICQSTNFAKEGYQYGVPMGGDLEVARNKKPRFAVSALADPGTAKNPGTPLQRIQVIKGWEENGKTHEKVIEVAGNPDNGASVDLSTCETSGAGYKQLCTVWEDNSFDPQQNSFYYARVVENPSCRWTQHQCVAAGVDCSNPDSVSPEWEGCCGTSRYPRTIQERAWSSPVWYTPER